ncbi:type IV pilus biogenesis protein PilM [Desulfitibacter alkalitolerans]|uniref:type IV pilus biogenesis protein PilM n=1 Tax=Desulfitibacter alkalitolerans TaxID=264641 RepID=UPI000489783F|nr:pilus assembly protein PilM [Desulfitibacter alkalitolerans]
MVIKFKRRNSRQLGIEISGKILTAVLCKHNTRDFELEQISIELDDNCVENGLFVKPREVSTLLNQLVKTHNWQGIDTVTTIVSRQMVVRHLDFPIMQDKELNETVKWEITQHIPYAEEDVIYDWCSLGPMKKDQPNMNTILLAAIPNATVNSYYHVFNETGVTLKAIDIVPSALRRWLLYLGMKQWPDVQVLTIGVINVGEEMTNLVIIKDGNIQFARSLAYGKQHLAVTGTEELFIEELYRSIEYYQNHYKGQLARIIITGVIDEKNRLHNMVSQIAQVRAEVGYIEINKLGPKYAVAAGLALKGVV